MTPDEIKTEHMSPEDRQTMLEILQEEQMFELFRKTFDFIDTKDQRRQAVDLINLHTSANPKYHSRLLKYPVDGGYSYIPVSISNVTHSNESQLPLRQIDFLEGELQEQKKNADEAEEIDLLGIHENIRLVADGPDEYIEELCVRFTDNELEYAEYIQLLRAVVIKESEDALAREAEVVRLAHAGRLQNTTTAESNILEINEIDVTGLRDRQVLVKELLGSLRDGIDDKDEVQRITAINELLSEVKDKGYVLRIVFDNEDPGTQEQMSRLFDYKQKEAGGYNYSGQDLGPLTHVWARDERINSETWLEFGEFVDTRTKRTREAVRDSAIGRAAFAVGRGARRIRLDHLPDKFSFELNKSVD